MWDTMELSEDDKMEVANINTVLGERAGVLKFVLKKVFGQLSPKDMKSVMLVCWEWKDVGEEPQFWAWVSLRVIRENLATMPEVLGRRRLQGVRELRVRAMSQDLLRVAAWQKGLRTVDMAETVLLAVRDAVMTTEQAGSCAESSMEHTGLGYNADPRVDDLNPIRVDQINHVSAVAREF